MTDYYVPELGQALWGQPAQELPLHMHVELALEAIRNTMTVMQSRDESDPFGNTGAKFKNDVFEVEAYSWNEKYEQPFNFKWKDFEVSWYKYFARGASQNRFMDFDECKKMLKECLESLLK